MQGQQPYLIPAAVALVSVACQGYGGLRCLIARLFAFRAKGAVSCHLCANPTRTATPPRQRL